MPGAKTRIRFDSGEEHRYKPSSMHKIWREGEDAPTADELELRNHHHGSHHHGGGHGGGNEAKQFVFEVGARVLHAKHGAGEVMEHIEDGAAAGGAKSSDATEEPPAAFLKRHFRDGFADDHRG